MEHRPYILLNATELSVIGKRIESACLHWSATWTTEPGEFAPRCYRAAEFDLSTLDASARWTRMSCGAGKWIAVARSAAFDATLARALIPSWQPAGVSAQNASLLADLVEAALADFVQLASGTTHAQWHDVERPGAEIWDVGTGAVAVHLRYAEEHAVLVICPELIATMLNEMPARLAPKVPLTKADDALARGRVKLNVLVGEASLELALLQTIVVGDVIKLDTKIDEPLQVVNDDGIKLCNAFLGCTEGQKSIRLAK